MNPSFGFFHRVFSSWLPRQTRKRRLACTFDGEYQQPDQVCERRLCKADAFAHRRRWPADTFTRRRWKVNALALRKRRWKAGVFSEDAKSEVSTTSTTTTTSSSTSSSSSSSSTTSSMSTSTSTTTTTVKAWMPYRSNQCERIAEEMARQKARVDADFAQDPLRVHRQRVLDSVVRMADCILGSRMFAPEAAGTHGSSGEDKPVVEIID